MHMTDITMIETVADVAPTAIDRPAVRWSSATRVAFRFCFLYFGLYVVTTLMLNGVIAVPNWGFPSLEMLPPFRNVIQWTALHAFRVTQPLVINGSGSGDKIANWVAAFCLLVIASLGTLVWSAIDRERSAYPSADRWFRLFLRFALATTMLSYGMVKLFPLQMLLNNRASLRPPRADVRDCRRWPARAFGSQPRDFDVFALIDAARPFIRIASIAFADDASFSSCPASESS